MFLGGTKLIIEPRWNSKYLHGMPGHCIMVLCVELNTFHIRKKVLSLKSAEKKIMFAIRALENIAYVEKNNVATTCGKESSATLRSGIKYFDSKQKKQSPPPPLLS